MTFSICAHCPRSGQVGVGAMTALLGVGKLVSHAQAGVGAAAAQAFVNPYLALDGLALLKQGVAPEAAVAQVIEADPGKAGRQLGLIDMRGNAAAWTGPRAQDWKGHRTGPHWAVQGNRLAGPEVLDAMVETYEASAGKELVERLLESIEAGEAAGGDIKGHQSATILVIDTEQYPLWELRIDHSDDPATAIRKLYKEVHNQLIEHVRRMPTRDNPMGDYDFSDDAQSA